METSTEEQKKTLKETLIDLTKSETYQAIVESFAGVMLGAFLVQVMFLVVAVAVGRPLFWLQMLGIILTFGVYMLFKDGAKASHMTIGNIILKGSPLIFSLSFIVTFMSAVTRNFGSGSLNIAPFLIMMSIGLMTGYVVLMFQPKVKEFFDDLEHKYTLDNLGSKGHEYSIGDMIIGKRYDIQYQENGDKSYELTNENVVIPLKDRYLHMLIIGPTGSGKTSQVLIPQIDRDIQNRDLGLIVLEPKGDLAEQVYAMAKYYGREEAVYFNPTHPDCPYFNPLSGPEDDVIENMTTTFKKLNGGAGKNPYFDDQGEMLIRRALAVLKRIEKDEEARETLYGDEATLIDLNTLIHNYESKGRRMITAFDRIPVDTDELQKENKDIATWFLSDYFTGSQADARGATPTYEHTSGMRNQVAKLVSNPHLSRVLNPPKGKKNEVDFIKSLAEGHVMALTTNQGKLQALGRFLGYFLILQLQSAVFKREGGEDTRRGCMLFIDEFQVYANDGFEDMLTQGRSYRVACHLATQAIGQISSGGADDRRFLAVVQTNCRNLVAFPDIDPEDAKWFSDKFGETMVKKINRGTSRQQFGLGNLGQFRPTNESVREDEQLQPYLTPADIMGRQFGEVSYKIMRNNSVDTPGIAKVEWIPMELKNTLDGIVDEYNSRLDSERAHMESIGMDTSTYGDTPHEDSLTPIDSFGEDDVDDDFSDFIDDVEESYSEEDIFGDIQIEERGEYVVDEGDIIDLM